MFGFHGPLLRGGAQLLQIVVATGTGAATFDAMATSGTAVAPVQASGAVVFDAMTISPGTATARDGRLLLREIPPRRMLAQYRLKRR